MKTSPLTLVAASYFPSVKARLTFDRAIDIGGLVGGAFTINDGEDAREMYHAATPATLVSANVVEFALVHIGDSAGDGVQLTATAGNGIVSVDDSVAWAGVSDAELPFPS